MSTRTALKKYPLHTLLSVFLLLCTPLLQAAANISVSADRNPIVLNEQFTLSFSADAQPAADPDFSPLEKDFDILRQGKSSSVSVINGDMTQNIRWNLALFPKQAGKITIPSIQFGSDASQAMEITIVEQSANSQQGQIAEDIIVEAEIEAKHSYVQQQIVYIQRLYYARDFFDNATLSTPQLKTGQIDLEKLGSGREYTETRQGRRYKVIERRYAIFPIQSGKLEIAPTFFEGRLIEKGQSRGNFGFFSRPAGQVVRRYSPAVNIDVQPQAASYTGQHWLPASRLTLHANWSTPPQQAKTGEPLTLTLGIIANGLRAEQLPQLQLNVPTGLKTYNDQPVLNNESNSNGIIGTRQEKIVVIATQAGTVTIPEISLTWWDTQAKKQQIATIPAMTLTATGETATAPVIPTPTAAPIAAVNNLPTATIANSPPNVPAVQTATLQSSSSHDNFWFYFSIFLLFILLVLIYLLWQQLSDRLSTTKTHKILQRPSLETLLAQVQQACTQQDNKALRIALCHWGQHVFQQRHINLQTLADQVNDTALRTEIQHLMNALYASESQKQQWSNQNLCQRIRQYTLPKPQKATRSRIASLYPE